MIMEKQNMEIGMKNKVMIKFIKKKKENGTAMEIKMIIYEAVS